MLVAVDLSHGSRLALRRAKALAARDGGRIVVLHVIDSDFVKQCISEHLGTESEIKKKLFVTAKTRLRDFLRSEGTSRDNAQMIICEGTPCVEINKKAVESDAEMIVMGCKGNSGDMKTMFFGSTTERVIRFIRRPVLCIPLNEDHEGS